MPTDGGSRALLEWAKSRAAADAGCGLDQRELERLRSAHLHRAVRAPHGQGRPRRRGRAGVRLAARELRAAAHRRRRFPRSLDIFDFLSGMMRRAAEVVSHVDGVRLPRHLLVLPVGDALQPFWPRGSASTAACTTRSARAGLPTSGAPRSATASWRVASCSTGRASTGKTLRCTARTGRCCADIGSITRRTTAPSRRTRTRNRRPDTTQRRRQGAACGRGCRVVGIAVLRHGAMRLGSTDTGALLARLYRAREQSWAVGYLVASWDRFRVLEALFSCLMSVFDVCFVFGTQVGLLGQRLSSPKLPTLATGTVQLYTTRPHAPRSPNHTGTRY